MNIEVPSEFQPKWSGNPYMVDSLIHSGEHLKMRKNILKIYNRYFSWDGIIENIEKRISK